MVSGSPVFEDSWDKIWDKILDCLGKVREDRGKTGKVREWREKCGNLRRL